MYNAYDRQPQYICIFLLTLVYNNDKSLPFQRKTLYWFRRKFFIILFSSKRFSSPEWELVSFSNHVLPGVRLSVRPLMFYKNNLFVRTTRPILIKLNTKQFWVKKIQVLLKRRGTPSFKGSYLGIFKNVMVFPKNLLKTIQ